MKRHTEFNEKSGNLVWLQCTGECHNETEHEVLASVSVTHTYDEDPSDFVEVCYTYELAQCKGCKTVSFRRVIVRSDDYWDENGYPLEREDVYPSRPDKYRKKIDGHGFWPSSVAAIYKETYAALCNSMPILAGTGLRTLIETICIDRENVRLHGENYDIWPLKNNHDEAREDPAPLDEIEDVTNRENRTKLLEALVGLKVLNQEEIGNLQEAQTQRPLQISASPGPRKLLRELVNRKILTAAQEKTLHRIMDMGDKAVHEARSHSYDTLHTAMDIVEHVMREVYINPRQAKNLPKTQK